MSKMVEMKKEKISDYKVIICDLDGTLYYQKPFRKRMLAFLINYLICHPSSFMDLLIVKKYREVREKWEELERENATQELDLDTLQYSYVAKKMGTTEQRVRRAISFFMMEAPLKLLGQYKDTKLQKLIEELSSLGSKIVIYSDYPVEQKLKALSIHADACFTSADAEISCMKPDPKGLQVIMQKLDCRPEDAIMIGDRYEKDGLAAISNQMDYCILSSSEQERNQFLNLLSI